jgi:hypothetical protein
VVVDDQRAALSASWFFDVGRAEHQEQGELPNTFDKVPGEPDDEPTTPTQGEPDHGRRG